MKDEFISRRKFLNRAGLAGLGILALGGGAWSCNVNDARDIPGRLLGPDFQNGHRLRDGVSPGKISRTVTTDILIVGGGVAGLACSWKLREPK